jgi:hypothetical protein
VHFQKGTLLDYDQIGLTEGPWPGEAYADAAELRRRRVPADQLQDYIIYKPCPVSAPGPILTHPAATLAE